MSVNQKTFLYDNRDAPDSLKTFLENGEMYKKKKYEFHCEHAFPSNKCEQSECEREGRLTALHDLSIVVEST